MQLATTMHESPQSLIVIIQFESANGSMNNLNEDRPPAREVVPFQG
jgi:hypothetical protein